jgi:hypothetical protein
MKERAIVTFVEDKTYLIIEIYNLYKSCLISNITNNTDFIICAPKEIWNKLPKDNSFIIFLDTNSVSNNCSSTVNKNCNLAWQGYHFVNSISCLAQHKDFLSKYKYILKTDCDVFITENFKDFFPDKFYTGTGGYVNNKDVKKRLKAIAKRKGYRHQDKFNIGATWYGRSDLILKCCELTLKILENILNTDFKNGKGKWPGWYRGVSSMYASEIAVNHLVDDIVITKKFDGHSDYTTQWKTDGVYHIHCWHTSKKYSKHAFMKNAYDNIDPSTLNTENTNDYCLNIALSNLPVLHSMQNIEKYITLPPQITIKNIYNDLLNNKQIDHYKLFNSQDNMVSYYIIIPILLCLLFLFIFLKYKKIYKIL